MKVWIIWDITLERPISVHKTETGCDRKVEELYKQNNYSFNADEFELED